MIWWLKLPSSITKTYPIYLSRPFSHTCPDQNMAAICSPVLAGTALLLFEFPLGELDEFARIYVWQNGQVWKNKNNKRNLLLDATVAALHWQMHNLFWTLWLKPDENCWLATGDPVPISGGRIAFTQKWKFSSTLRSVVKLQKENRTSRERSKNSSRTENNL